MNRIVLVAGISIAIFISAVYSGWSHYLEQPEGDLFYTPVTQCAPRVHSFSTGYMLVLIAVGLVFLAIAIVSMLATLVPRWSQKKSPLKSIAVTSISVVLVLFAFSFISSIFEAKLPLHIKPQCLQNVP